MRVILGKSVTDAVLVASNVPETLSLYSAITTYAAGDLVRDDATHHAFKSVVGSNLGNPLTDISKWLDLGPTNKWAMFDQINGTATSYASVIDVSLQLSGRANALALLGLSGQSVQVTVSTAAAGTIYDETFSLLSDYAVTDWYTYLNEDIVYRSTLVVSDLPYNLDPLVRVRVFATAATASVGSLVIGPLWEVGETIYPAKAGIRDYSRVEPNAYGDYTIVQRVFSRRQTLKVAIEAAKVDITHERLASYRATPLVWVGSDTYDSLVSFGFLRDWGIDISSPAYAYLTAEIEGLT